ncbi:hypothetical protein EI94DRAFT_1710409 [Lactarius quietus]|nr:hypothetical protein EI94DRAFT_1710409 [Lactarius quietus]
MPPRRQASSTTSGRSSTAGTPQAAGPMPPPPVPSNSMPPPPIPAVPTVVNEHAQLSPSDGPPSSNYCDPRPSSAVEHLPLVKTELEDVQVPAQDAAMRSPSTPIQELTDDECATPAAPPRITRTSFLHRKKHAGASRAPPASKEAAKVKQDKLQHIENTKKLIKMCDTVEEALSEAYTELLNIKKYAENVKAHYEADL